MNKTEFIKTVSEQNLHFNVKGIVEEKRITQSQAGEIYDMIFGEDGAIQKGLRMDGEVKLPGFGRVYVANVAERECRNPSTGETMTVDAHKTVRFKPASALKDAAN